MADVGQNGKQPPPGPAIEEPQWPQRVTKRQSAGIESEALGASYVLLLVPLHGPAVTTYAALARQRLRRVSAAFRDLCEVVSSNVSAKECHASEVKHARI